MDLRVRHLDRKAARLDGQKKKEEMSRVCRQVNVKSVSNNLPPLEVREEILGTKMNDKRSDGPWLVEGIVNEKTTCSEMKNRDKESRMITIITISETSTYTHNFLHVKGLMFMRDTETKEIQYVFFKLLQVHLNDVKSS